MYLIEITVILYKTLSDLVEMQIIDIRYFFPIFVYAKVSVV